VLLFFVIVSPSGRRRSGFLTSVERVGIGFRSVLTGSSETTSIQSVRVSLWRVLSGSGETITFESLLKLLLGRLSLLVSWLVIVNGLSSMTTLGVSRFGVTSVTTEEKRPEKETGKRGRCQSRVGVEMKNGRWKTHPLLEPKLRALTEIREPPAV